MGRVDVGNGPPCPVAEHGQSFLIQGRPWCPHQSHDVTGGAWLATSEPEQLTPGGRRARSRRGRRGESDDEERNGER